MHSLSHSLHNLSDIIICNDNTNNENAQTPNFNLYVPTAHVNATVSEDSRQFANDIRRFDPPTQDGQGQQRTTETDRSSEPNQNFDPTNIAYQLTVQLTTDVLPFPYELTPQFVFLPPSILSDPSTNSQSTNSRDANQNINPTPTSTASATPLLIRIPEPLNPNSNNNATASDSQPSERSSGDYIGPFDSFVGCHSHFHPQSMQNFTTSVRNVGLTASRPRRRQTQPSNTPPTTNVPPTTTTNTTPAPSTPTPNVTPASPPTRDLSSVFPASVVPVIQNDIEKQKIPRNIKSFSDGYAACCPSKKRKMQEQEDALNFLQKPLAEAFIDSLSSIDIQPTDLEGLRNALKPDSAIDKEYKKTVDAKLRSKLKQSDLKDHHVECKKFINKK